jgi:hypothetical protein
VAHAELVRRAAVAYPDDTKADARVLIRADAAAEAQLRTCAKAKNFASWNSSWSRAVKANEKGHEPANLIRLDLGLPPVPG